MIQGDPVGAPSHAPRNGVVAVLVRLGMGLLIIAAITGAGLVIYRYQRDRGGMPVVVAPAPRETPAPTVENVITRFQKQVALAPDDADGWRNLGWLYFQREQFAQAADALRHATVLDPTDARTFSFMGEALLQEHKAQRRVPYEARAAFDEALKRDPKDARARYYRAVGWDLAGQHRRAIHAWFALLKETSPDAPYAGDIRAVIRTVGARHHIKVEKRLAEVQFVAPGSALTSTTPVDHHGATTLPGPAGDRMRAVEDVPRPVRSGAAQGN
jgi:cytochrome c-type biogenesis protein CcmH